MRKVIKKAVAIAVVCTIIAGSSNILVTAEDSYASVPYRYDSPADGRYKETTPRQKFTTSKVYCTAGYGGASQVMVRGANGKKSLANCSVTVTVPYLTSCAIRNTVRESNYNYAVLRASTPLNASYTTTAGHWSPDCHVKDSYTILG